MHFYLHEVHSKGNIYLMDNNEYKINLNGPLKAYNDDVII